MSAMQERGFGLSDDKPIYDFMRRVKYGDVIEMTDPDGKTVKAVFEIAVIRHKDLCHYIRVRLNGETLVLVANFKANRFFDISDRQDCNKIRMEMEARVANYEKYGVWHAGYETREAYPSTFSGGMLSLFFLGLLTRLITLLTLGLAYPWARCMFMRWKVNHTSINGRQLVFTGQAVNLYLKYLLWYLLSVITLGIYYLVAMRLNLVRWEKENTHIEGNKPAESAFDGKWYELFGVNIVYRLVMIVTLSFGVYWAHCYVERWYAKHTVIDGARQVFTGTGMQYFGKCIVWVLLTIVTLGIYSFWLNIKSEKWTTKHTLFENPKELSVPPTKFSDDDYKLAVVSNLD